jgi:hypothetical protein
VRDRNPESNVDAAQTGFSAMDFVDTVPAPPDDGGASASPTPSPPLSSSSLFLDDLSDARPARGHPIRAHGETATGVLTRPSTGESVAHPIASPGGAARPRLAGMAPSADTARFDNRSTSVAVARSDAAIRPTPRTSAPPRSPEVFVNQDRFPPPRKPDAPTVRQATALPPRMLASGPRRMLLLAAVMAAFSIVVVMRAGSRSSQAPRQDAAVETAAVPDVSMSSSGEQRHAKPATAAEPVIDAQSAARSTQDAEALPSPQPPASTSAAVNQRHVESSPGQGIDQASPPPPTPRTQRRVVVAAREAIAASVAAAQSKADAFLRSQSAAHVASAPDSGAP